VLAEAGHNPWLASILMRRLDTLRRRFAELCDWLRALPRRLRRGLAKRWAMALPAAALLLALGSWAATARMDAAITVGVGGRTLADAITAANTDAATGGCGAGSGADTIYFNAVNGTYSYTSALPSITTDVTIQGNGNTTIQRTGGPAFSVLRVGATGTLALGNATISGGSALAGGGIYNLGTVVVDGSTVSGNTATYNGSGIVTVFGPVMLTNSTVSGNTAGHSGGIFNYRASIDITNSTISGNTSTTLFRTAGVATYRGTTRITNSTISGNSTFGGVGGVGSHYGTVFLTNSTVSGNSTANGAGGGAGGIASNRGPVTIINSTVSGNSGGTGGAGGGGDGGHDRFTHGRDAGAKRCRRCLRRLVDALAAVDGRRLVGARRGRLS